MDDRLQPELKVRLDESPFGFFDIEIEFTEVPDPEELASLGLAPEGMRAFGKLNRDRILALLKFPQVRFIRLSERPQAPAKESSDSRLAAPLQSAMRDSAETEFDVIVSFRGPPKSSSLPEQLAVFHDVGSGKLSREQILELAGSEEVLSLNLRPDVQPI